MRTLILVFAAIIGSVFTSMAQLTVQTIGQLPEKVSNNAVCEGYINGRPYLFSFGGIDESLSHSGIHLKCYGYDILEDTSFLLPDLPDTLGKIASAASRIDNIIYIAGGYHVYASGGEKSSSRLHRFDINNRTFLSDAADIPVPIDDHVQGVWRDSLLFIITGWSETTNVTDVQIYDPITDQWSVGTSIPNQNQYKSFGSSGIIIGDTIYYFGGASSGSGFPIQHQLRIGIIDPINPTNISWSFYSPDLSTKGYRMACALIKGSPHWIGGSLNTYNYNGLAYDGSGDSPLANRDLFYNQIDSSWNKTFTSEIPMDLRGVASLNDSVVYLAGGMLSGRTVTNNIYRLEWNGIPTGLSPQIESSFRFNIFPNPGNGIIQITFNDSQESEKMIRVYDIRGQEVKSWNCDMRATAFDASLLGPGLYIVHISSDKGILGQQRFVIK